MYRRHIFINKRFLIIAIIVIATLTTVGFANASNVSAEDAAGRPLYKYYKTIEVKSGDTLWDIACEYNDLDNESIDSYIDEIKSINSILNVNSIQIGQQLTVYYYSTERL